MDGHKRSVGLVRSLVSPQILIALFELDAVLSFNGCIQFKVLAGKIDVSGYLTTPTSSFQTLYSPAYGSASIVMTTSSLHPPISPVILYNSRECGRILDGHGLKVELHYRDIQQLNNIILNDYKWSNTPLGAIALIKETSTPLLESLKAFSSTSELFKNYAYSLIKNFTTITILNRRSLVIPPSYHQLCIDISQSQQVPVILICGYCNSGKSTLARFLTNYMLNHYSAISFLECDVGQCEFTVPGVISLHTFSEPIYGPNFVHLRTPEKAFIFGDTSPQSDPTFYLSLIDSCLKHYLQNTSHVTGEHTPSAVNRPLIVNTCGWTTGLGIPILMDIIRLVSPSHIIQFSRAHPDPFELPELTHEYITDAPSWYHLDTKEVTKPRELASDIGMFSSNNIDTLRNLKSKGEFVPIIISSEGEKEEEREEEEREEEREEEEEEEEEEDSDIEIIEVTGDNTVKRKHNDDNSRVKTNKKRKTSNSLSSRSTAIVHKRDLNACYRDKCSLFTITRSFNWPQKYSSNQRQASIISYFSPLLDTLPPSTLRLTAVNNFIMAATPYSVPWSSLAIHSIYKKVPPSQLLYAINGRFVWLGKVQEDELTSHGKEGIFKLVRSESTKIEYIGLGLVRGIEPDKRLIYITTPVPPLTLSSVNCLVAGNSEKPSLIVSQKHIKSPCPYLLQHFQHANCGKLGYSTMN